MQEYLPQEIETKWQNYWEEQGLLDFDFASEKPKYYMLTMLPYPSGDLHIGHWYAMAPSDSYARFMKMQGNEVFFFLLVLTHLVCLQKMLRFKIISIQNRGRMPTLNECRNNCVQWETCSPGKTRL